MSHFDAIVQDIEQATGHQFTTVQTSTISGGGINSAFKLSDDSRTFFVKLNAPNMAYMFDAEAQGLSELAATQCIRIPEVICHGQTQEHSYLVLEYIDCRGFTPASSRLMGEQLAQLHHIPQTFFGWHSDNTIGSTPQYNPREYNWLVFWRQHRLAQQLKFAKQNGFASTLQTKGEQLLAVLPSFFDTQPVPALLHGDLWSGNAAADHNGNPVIFDPACYYGDREADIAMTELFGGFSADFYDAYQASYPLDAGYQTRKTLYNLYHIINHVNLFGGGYLSQATNMIDQLLSETR